MLKDGSVTAVRKAVAAQLNDELAARESGRAERYVSTVRPVMVTLRYVHQIDKDDDDDRVPTSEEGGEAMGGIRVTEEGATVRMETRETDGTTEAEPSPLKLGMELTDEAMVKLGNVAAVRMAVKRSRRAAKQLRVQQAHEKTKDKHGDDEVARVVAELERGQLLRRQLQADEARKALEVRRQHRAADSEVRADERARVNLVRHDSTTVDGETDGDGKANVEASDGLTTAAMIVDVAQQQVKIDSGARYSVAGTDWMARGERKRVDAPVAYVEGIGGFLLDVLGFLVGVDFLGGRQATMDFDRGEVRYAERGHDVIIPFRTTEEKDDSAVAAVRLVSATNLQKSAVQTVEVAVAASDSEEGALLPTVNSGVVLLASAVTKVEKGKILIPAINAYGGRIKLPSRKELGVWIPINQDIELLTMHGELQPERVQAWLDELGDTNMPLDDEHDADIGAKVPDARALILRLLRAYRDLANAQDECPPTTTLNVEHHIDTGDAAPIMMRRRRQAQTEDVIVDSNVDAMLSAGVIEHGEGAWGFPVVLVHKKDGSVRFCAGYRALNSVIRRDVYPLPRIDETLESLGGARLFTTLDLRSGYWRIRVAEEDRDQTAFMTKRGLYRFRRVPFGLTKAPATFQRLMNGVLRGLTWMTCLVYLDGIIIFTKGVIEQHVIELADVLERLRTAGLSLKLKKCTFATTSMEYLGHYLSDKSVQPAERLVRYVREFPRPADATEVKRFVHLAGYYRKFIAAFGSIVEPMTRLLKKDVQWEWSGAQEFAFERVKMLLTTRPLLLYPNFELPFRLVTDASIVGWASASCRITEGMAADRVRQ
ncbi:unnamed protein product [Phytophthora fragariaefolia]|uniref:Unnamed protein product n=1 Tax=Phytophthora fragariaefolia TaxID=1490495 RepID=A0A9W6Y9E3_9STRA|nr:unnamed protein product [Phytophthora fragariaefolia]